MEWTSVVKPIQDGTGVTAANINGPINALADRTQYLYERLASSASNSILLAPAQPVADDNVVQYSVVYFDGDNFASTGIKLASPKLASLALHPFFRGANSAHVFGVVKDTPQNATADVILQGLVAGEGIVTSMLDASYPDFVAGPLYLSAIADGKVSPTPNGLAIFVAYAKSLDEIYLNPNQESLSELFWSFRYNLLDRPAGEIQFTSGAWNITAPSGTKVGWIRATDKLTSPQLTALFPDGSPKYFYQLPDQATIEANNTELTAAERQAAKNLRAALPARPNAFSFLTVNGVVYSPRIAAEDRSSYVLNDVGLWWFADAYDSNFDTGEFDQPWASDLATSLQVDVSQTAGQNIFLTDSQGQSITGLDTTVGFAVNHVIRFFAGTDGVLPSPLLANTDYIIKTVSSNSFTIATAAAPTVTLTLADAGTAPWYLKWHPDFWRIGKGSPSTRPIMNLQFTKLNPDIRQNLVTSLQSDPTVATPAVKISNLALGDPATTGDLKVKFELPVVGGWDGQLASINPGKAVKGVGYDSVNERLQLSIGTVVSEIRNGGGLKIEVDQTSGVYTMSFANAYANAITELEPEQSRLEYYGLNSYLAMEYNTTPTGVVGKFTLPDQIVSTPSSYLNLIMTLVGKVASTSTTRKLRFKFEYSVAQLGKPISSTTVLVSPVELTMPVISNSIYQAYYSVEGTGDAGAISPFRIPVSDLAGKATVNFRISRLVTDPTTNLYTGAIGMSGLYWLLL